MRLSKIISLVAALVFAGVTAHADAPGRVVSINLCTDQLALMLGAPGQLISVTPLAQSPRSSPMAAAARALPVNHARAEEIYLMKPDLVLAGQFSDRATIAMLRRLGIRVELFAPAYGLEDVTARIAQMGAALGQEARAARMIDEFNSDLATLGRTSGPRPRAALYYANGYTSGDASLAGQILRAAGFDNIAQELGHGAIGALPLEVLAMAAPDVVITGQPYPGASRSEAIMDHPVIASLKRGHTIGTVTDRDWVCGTPHLLRAIENLAHLRRQLEGGK